jgi:cyclopropane fatty-acyl-phospholipid synthase-like methyltransferase
MKPYSESCDQNKEPILAILQKELVDIQTVLEIGSGTGQHAVYFSNELDHLHWICSDLEENHHAISEWLSDSTLENIEGPLLIDVNQEHWLDESVCAIFSANSAHIMSWSSVVNMMSGVAKTLLKGGVFCLYGPFNYKGDYTSESNRNFDAWLKNRNPESGIREFEKLNFLAYENNMILKKDYEMPANNRLLVWVK